MDQLSKMLNGCQELLGRECEITLKFSTYRHRWLADADGHHAHGLTPEEAISGLLQKVSKSIAERVDELTKVAA
jgi:hypothetical protein